MKKFLLLIAIVLLITTGCWGSDENKTEQSDASSQKWALDIEGFEGVNGAEITSYLSDPEEIEIYYKTDKTSEEVKKHYEDLLTEKEWEFVYDEDEELYYTKDEKDFFIYYVIDEESEYSIDYYDNVLNEQVTTKLENNELPENDIQGADINGVDRYKNSVRLDYYQDSEGIDVSYITKESLEDVKNYYNSEIVSQGWELISEENDEGDIYIDFQKGNSENPSYLMFYFTQEEDNDIVTYEISLYYPLSEEDLAELEQEDDEVQDEIIDLETEEEEEL